MMIIRKSSESVVRTGIRENATLNIEFRRCPAFVSDDRRASAPPIRALSTLPTKARLAKVQSGARASLA